MKNRTDEELTQILDDFNMYEREGKLVAYATALCKLGDWETFQGLRKFLIADVFNNNKKFTTDHIRFLFHRGKQFNSPKVWESWRGW